MSHGGMDMGGGEANSTCKISMLWNWYTIDSCFLSETWHVKNGGMFAASCIGIALLVICLELVRKLGHEYDALLLRQFKRSVVISRVSQPALKVASAATKADPNSQDAPSSLFLPSRGLQYATQRVTPLQQLCRAVLHAITLGLAYIIMLIAMSYNGYIIISIILGALVGKFICDWMVLKVQLGGGDQAEELSIQDESTACCG